MDESNAGIEFYERSGRAAARHFVHNTWLFAAMAAALYGLNELVGWIPPGTDISYVEIWIWATVMWTLFDTSVRFGPEGVRRRMNRFFGKRRR